MKKQSKVNHFPTSTPVMVRSYNTSNKWTPGTITRELGNMHYEVNGSPMKCHIDQILPSFVNSSTPTQPSDQNLPSSGESTPEEHRTPLLPLDSDVSDSTPSDTSFSTTNVDSPVSIPIPRVNIEPRVLPDRSNRGKPPERLNL